MEGKILIITHFNYYTEEYLNYGCELARIMHKPVLLLHIYNKVALPSGFVSQTNLSNTLSYEDLENHEKLAISELEKQINLIRLGMTDAPQIDYQVATGFEMAILDKIFANQKIDLILTGNYSETDFLSLDPLIPAIIEDINCPVWILPSGYRYKPVSKMIYATDYNQEDIHILKKIVGIARQFNAHIIALHFTDNKSFDERVRQEGFQNLLDKQTGYENISVKIISSNDGIKDTLNDYADKSGSGLIVMLKKNRGFLQKIFKADETRKMIYRTQIPLLIFHYKE